MRSMVFRRDANIPMFCNELRIVITELFGITDADTIEKIALNDVMGKFDSTITDHLKVLQLTGTCKFRQT